MNTRHFFLLTLVFCAVVAVAVAADDRPNFSGIWKLNVEKSDFGPLPKPDSAGYVLHHAGANLVIDLTQDDKKAHIEIVTDGIERMTESDTEHETWTRAFWTGPVLVLESRVKARPAHESPNIRWTSRWSLSDDRKMLAVQKHFWTPDGEFDQKLIYERK